MFKANLSRRRHRAVVGLGAAVASLAFTGVASANTVTPVTPDVPITFAAGGSCPATATSSNLTTAIQNAAANTTLVLEPGIYCPITPSGQSTITISKNLNMVVDHSAQATGGGANYEISGIDSTGAYMFTVNPGVTLNIQGFDIEGGGTGTGAAVLNNGTVNSWGMMFENDLTDVVNNASTAVTNLDDTTLSDSLGDSLENDGGTITLDEADIINGSGHAIDMDPNTTTKAYNTLIANNNTAAGECSIEQLTTAVSVVSDDSSCGPGTVDSSNIDNYVGANASAPGSGGENTNGGPTTSTSVQTNSDTSLKGNSTYCFLTDQRFFVNPIVGGKVECDIGALTDEVDATTGASDAGSAVQETTAPSCHATFTDPTGVSQQVTLADSGSGIGPEIGLATDNPANVISTTYPPAAAAPVPGYAVSNLQITNGSVSFTSPTAPQPSLVLTAGNKTTAGVDNSQWSFTGLNWAGVAKNCF